MYAVLALQLVEQHRLEVALQDFEHHVEFVLAVDDGLVAKVGQQDWDLVRARPALPLDH